VIAYLDSSVVLRIVLGQPNQLAEWGQITSGVASALLETECLRTLDRLRASGALATEDAAIRREAVFRVLDEIELVELTRTVLHRAGQPMPAPIGTLDSIHLASAELWREARGTEIVMATHDRALALAARASGFRAIGAD
jgi:predicted nucleic acid-binding protein